MWFKQAQLFQLKTPVKYDADALAGQLEQLPFRPCLPTLPMASGWASPLNQENADLVHAAGGYLLICLQIEEKILPASVVKQALEEKIKSLESETDRPIRGREKQHLREEITQTLLPKAFTRLQRLYGYIDTKQQMLVVNTTQQRFLDPFLSALKKTAGIETTLYEIQKPMSILTNWLKNDAAPSSLTIEKNGVLQDPSQENRVIRCREQSLHAESIQSLLADGCGVKQLGLTWHEHVTFVLADDFTLRNIRFSETAISENEARDELSAAEQFDADFILMSQLLSPLLQELLSCFKAD